MSGGQLRLKVSIDGQETRRFALQAPITQARLADLIASVLPAEKAKATFVIQYTDDEGELITIGSDADLKEAITLMEEMNLKALKLSVGTTFSGPKVATAAPLKAEAVPVKAEAAPAPAPQVEEEKKEEGAVPQSDQEKFEAALQYLTSQFTRLDAELVTPEILGLVTLVQQLVVNLEAGQKVTWEKVTQDAQHLAPVISSLPCFHEESDKFLNSLEAIAKFFIEHVESGLLYPIPPQFAPLLVCKSESILKKLSTIEGIPLQLSVILEHMASFASKLETVESQGSEAGDSKEEESNVHVGVQCDNCQANPIVGNRYKCTACHNFDLCEACEASGVHPEDHELVKFKVPQKKNRRHGGGRHHHWGGPQAWGPFPGMEFAAAAAAAGGHCHGGRRWRNSGSGFAPRRMASPVAPAAPALKDGLSLHFVNDVNMPDKTVLERGSFVVKSWTVKNDGKQDWDNEVKLVYVSGNKEGLLDGIESYDVALLKSGETGDLNVPLVAPAKPGTYRTVFRLAKNGVQFGHHIWVEFLVQ